MRSSSLQQVHHPPPPHHPIHTCSKCCCFLRTQVPAHPAKTHHQSNRAPLNNEERRGNSLTTVPSSRALGQPLAKVRQARHLAWPRVYLDKLKGTTAHQDSRGACAQSKPVLTGMATHQGALVQDLQEAGVNLAGGDADDRDANNRRRQGEEPQIGPACRSSSSGGGKARARRCLGSPSPVRCCCCCHLRCCCCCCRRRCCTEALAGAWAWVQAHPGPAPTTHPRWSGAAPVLGDECGTWQPGSPLTSATLGAVFTDVLAAGVVPAGVQGSGRVGREGCVRVLNAWISSWWARAAPRQALSHQPVAASQGARPLPGHTGPGGTDSHQPAPAQPSACRLWLQHAAPL